MCGLRKLSKAPIYETFIHVLKCSYCSNIEFVFTNYNFAVSIIVDIVLKDIGKWFVVDNLSFIVKLIIKEL